MTINTATLGPVEAALFRLRALYSRYGYSQYKMSKFEEYDLYARNKSFLLSENVITFTDTNGKLMALKPDVTLSIVKNSKDLPGTVQKVYYNENIYRVSANTHSFREIMQTGLECLGDIDDYCVAEVMMLACESLAAISPSYILDVSHLGLLSVLLERTGASPALRERLMDCIAHKSLHEARELCREAGLSEEDVLRLGALSECTGTPEAVIPRLYALYGDAAWTDTVRGLERILALLPSERIRIDFSLVGDLNYYNGIVFQGFVEGIPESVLRGGQYDLMMQRMNKRAGAIGFAVYLDRLEALDNPPADYDIDTVLLYGADADAATVSAAVEKLSARVDGVLAVRALPEKLKYRQLLKLTEGEVTVLEENA